MSQKQSLSSAGGIQIAPFKFDVTPPLGHSCCGGWIKPVEAIDDALEANGIVFLGAGRPIVLCAVDWTGLSNATHPMSFYADGRVTSDFAGLARKRRQKDEPECHHIYFTGCAGNIGAGKYNDGTPAARLNLTRRIYEGMIAAEAKLTRLPLPSLEWKTTTVCPSPRQSLSTADLATMIATRTNSVLDRNRAALWLGSLRRLEQKAPIILSALHLGPVKLLHLPGEPFIEFQLRAQQMQPDAFVCTAAYGDGGPWYIPVKEEWPNGGYEVSAALCDPSFDDQLTAAMQRLLADSPS